jgi:hypothetical protein
MRHFYGVDAVNFAGVPIGNGQGQTIAIVDAFDDPFAFTDLQHFDNFYGLADPPSFLKYNQKGQLLQDSGGHASPPSVGPLGNGWQIETSIDIEWAHVIAPAANIVLVETDSTDFSDLFAGVTAAATLPNVGAVSMSWGADESADEATNDSIFTTPNVVFLAATGDSGTGGTAYPAASPNVLSVGGTTISFAPGTTDGTYGSETAWGAGGGRISPYEPKPAYQNAVLSGSFRGTPDVSMDADPATGVDIYDSYDFGSAAPWAEFGGTSLASPMYAGLIAIADQGRAAASLARFSGGTDALPALYSAPAAGFHDITTGSNGTPATVGYDTATGLGTPVANKLLNAITGVPANSILTFTQQPTDTTAGTSIGGATGFKVAVLDNTGQIISTDSSTVTITLNGATFANGATTATAQAVNGIATFTGKVINKAGAYTFTATDGTVSPATSASFNITASGSVSMTFLQGPSDTTAGSAISPSVVVALKDVYGNIATGDNSVVTMNVFSGPGTLSGNIATLASAGIATFSNLVFTTAGTYKIQPVDGFITGPASLSFAINPAATAGLVFGQQPTDTTTGNTISPAVIVDVEDQYGNIITSANYQISVTLSHGKFSSGGISAVVTANQGVARFAGLVINDAGSYTLSASGGGNALITSNSFNVTMVDVVTATSSTHSFTLRKNPFGSYIDWFLGSTSGTIPINDPNGLTLNGDANNDPITLNYSFGSPFPSILHLNGTFTIGAMQGANPLANTQIEIGHSTVYFAYAASSPASFVLAALTAGYNNGAWNGLASTSGAITSTTAAAGPANTFGIGYADSTDGIVVGQPANTVEVRYTAMGDANLDRTIDSADALLMSRNYMVAGKTAWDQGNFNYDSTINLADAQLLQKNFNMTVTISAVSASPTTPSIPTTPPATSTTSTPPTISVTSTPTSPDPESTVLKRRSRSHLRAR